MHTLPTVEGFCSSALCVSGNPLQFSGSRLSTFGNEQLVMLFPRSLSADEGCSASFSLLFGAFFTASVPTRKVLQRGNCVRYVFPVGYFRTVWRTGIVRDRKGEEEGRVTPSR